VWQQDRNDSVTFKVRIVNVVVYSTTLLIL
jgi:hypothetical protein